MKIAFIGTGIMGLPMAKNLQTAGYELVLSDHFNTPPAELVTRGATVCHSPKEATESADVTILMLPNTPQVEEVLFDADGVEQGLASGNCKLVIDMSSISPMVLNHLLGVSKRVELSTSMLRCRAEKLER
ncbi:2-hydroxy-3-oxopropionate reductase [Vibrio variabilis]|uniref:2-hydroxy-3-oxopropionate reductase n=1 Tax=Vibrio variabilis TaxID=990271 RepID=A0ABQ0JNG9_9VIBR|nr:2-hydroxy-3-oxopropionate reductase [Vibrio variabilis]